MKHSTIMLLVTLFVIAIGIFSAWFFPLNGAPLAGVVLATGYFVATALSATVTMLLAREGN
jgi:uncharacterized protein (DUF58 family)